MILASQWDPISVPPLAVQRAIFLVLETLIDDPRNQVRQIMIYTPLAGRCIWINIYIYSAGINLLCKRVIVVSS